MPGDARRRELFVAQEAQVVGQFPERRLAKIAHPAKCEPDSKPVEVVSIGDDGIVRHAALGTQIRTKCVDFFDKLIECGHANLIQCELRRVIE